MSERIRVAIRVRPRNDTEASRDGGGNAPMTVTCPPPVSDKHEEIEYCGGSSASDNKRFTFDHVFQPSTTQSSLFETVGLPTVRNVLSGFNGTILAYGQTSSGKTHTMMGPSGGSPELLSSEERGLIPRVVEYLLGELSSRPEAELSWEVQMSVFELYNEELFDLCAGSSASGGRKSSDLRIREDRTSGRGVYVENLVTSPIRTPTEALQIIMDAAKAKHVSATHMNETSSRSHTLVQLFVDQTDHVAGDSKTSAQLFLVDLAGSERVDKTGARGERLKEAQNINLSLSLLGNVINKLTDGKSLHVPYRDAKLTRLLQDSLGGNAMTTLLCACSPSSYNAAETLSTLQFANRAKSIQNQPRANKQLSDDELRKAYALALEEIAMLKGQLQNLQLLSGGEGRVALNRPGAQQNAESSEGATLRSTLASLANELSQEREERMRIDKDVLALKQRVEFWESRGEAAQKQATEWKAKYDREKLACDSWARKCTELTKGPPASTTSSTEKKPTTAKPSGKKGANKASTAVDKPSTPPQVPTPPQSSSDTTDATLLKNAQENEMRALVRERMMLAQIEELRDKLQETHRYPVIIERMTREAEQQKEAFERRMEEKTGEYEALLKRQDVEIGELHIKLDQRVSRCQELEGKLEAQPQPKQKNASSDELDRLRLENEILHDENKANATRLFDFAKRLEKQNAEIGQLKDEREKLLSDIEKANIGADLKAKLLGNRIDQQRANFKKRLLECFANPE